MYPCTAVLALSAALATTAGPSPTTIFRISANGPSMDQALQAATLIISQRCAANGYVILNNQIRPSPDGVFYYGPVTARCVA